MRNSRLGVRNRNNASTRTRTSTPARAFSAMRATISVPPPSPARISSAPITSPTIESRCETSRSTRAAEVMWRVSNESGGVDSAGGEG